MPKPPEAENDNLLIEDMGVKRLIPRPLRLGNTALTAPEYSRHDLIRLIKAAGKLGGLALVTGVVSGIAFEAVRDH